MLASYLNLQMTLNYVGTVSSEVELEQLRTDLKRLYSWSIDWQVLFNTDKCKVVHFIFIHHNMIESTEQKYSRNQHKKTSASVKLTQTRHSHSK